MNIIRTWLFSTVVMGASALLMLPADSYAQSAYESVVESTDILVEKLKEVQPLYKEDPDRFFAEVQKSIDPYIDFEGFARGVMAKHYRTATEAQREAFQARFRESLVRTYATALLEFDNERVKVLEPTTPQKREDRAIIDLEIHTNGGTVYPLNYQLALEGDRWLLRNVIINGINVGLQFRSQFNAYVQQYKDIDKVIENWSTDVDGKA